MIESDGESKLQQFQTIVDAQFNLFENLKLEFVFFSDHNNEYFSRIKITAIQTTHSSISDAC